MAAVGLDDQDPTPQATKGFGPREDADASRQAQHEKANDVPVDVNPNAIIARAQAETITQMGKTYLSNADRLDKIFNDVAAWRSGKLV
jgi:hypothetical protein